MKYMGSKRFMLQNGLGELIREEAKHAKRFVDLFCGAGSVAWFAARDTALPVLAIDLQTYAVIMARAVIGRRIPIDNNKLIMKWLNLIKHARTRSRLWSAAVDLQEKAKDIRNIPRIVQNARYLCKEPSQIGPVWNSYGGHYFSPTQALTFDYMLKYAPKIEPERSVCLAAVISAASKCVAAPGHTAQPFQPTNTAKKFVFEAWRRNPLSLAQKALEEICPQHAKTVGETQIANAVEVASTLKPGDLVFIDPPYSGVHYSRFYHVLETMARGYCTEVSGVGRYPPFEDRPQSAFSNKSQSKEALEGLLSALALSRATIIFTFPTEECSNGLSGTLILETAKRWFVVNKKIISGHFSTLGGNNSYRASRKYSSELLLLLKPKETL